MKCPNCKAPIERIDGFCWNCGQKNKDGRITLREFFKDILENVLNIDAKIFRTIGHLMIPAKLSIRYFQGQRKQYFSPFRIFFVSALLHFALISFLSADQVRFNGRDGDDVAIEKRGYLEAFRHELDTAKTYVLETFDEDTAIVKAAMDTLYTQLPALNTGSMDLSYFYLNEDWQIKKVDVKLSYEEMMRYSLEELSERHEVKGWISRLQFQQAIKLNKDGKNFILFLIKNLLWMVIVMMAALALILKLLYIRRERFLIEHLVFAFHYHSFAFLVISLAFVLSAWRDSDGIVGLGFLGVLIYLFIAMRRFYRQGRFKTFIKFSILNISYLFIFVLFITLTFVISMFIF